MTRFKLIFIVSCVICTLGIRAEISDKRLCANEDCTVPISTARTLLHYHASEKGMLSFGPNAELTIYSKSAGKNKDLWGAEYRGERGYVPVKFLREQKVFKKDLQFEVDTLVSKEVPSDNTVLPIKVEPDKPEMYVVDGTTIYEPNSIIDVSSVTKESPIVPTAVPLEIVNKDSVNEIKESESEETVDKVKLEDSESNQEDDSKGENIPENSQDKLLAEKLVQEDINSNIDKPQETSNEDNQSQGLNASTGENYHEAIKIESEDKEIKPNIETSDIVDKQPVIENTSEDNADVIKKFQVSDNTNEQLSSESDENYDEEVSIEVDEESLEDINIADDANQTETETTSKLEKEISNESDGIVGMFRRATHQFEELQTTDADTKSEEPEVSKPEYDEVEVRETEKLSAEYPGDDGDGDNVNEPNDQIKEPSVASDKVINDNVTKENDSSESTTLTLPEDVQNEVTEKVINATSIPPDYATEQVINSTSTSLSDSTDQVIIDDLRETPPTLPENVQDPSVLKEEKAEPPPLPTDANKLPVQTDYYANIEKAYGSELKSGDVEHRPMGSDLYPTNDKIPTGGDIYSPTEKYTEHQNNNLERETVYPPVEELPIEVSAQDSVKENEKEVDSVAVSDEEKLDEETRGFFGYVLNFFSGMDDNGKETSEGLPDAEKDLKIEDKREIFMESKDDVLLSRTNDYVNSCTMDPSGTYCTNEEKPAQTPDELLGAEEDSFMSVDLHDLLKLLGVSAATTVIFLWGYILIDKMRKEGPLIAKINNLEQALLVTSKENQILTEKLSETDSSSRETIITNGIIEELKVELESASSTRSSLEEQIQSLEKELENSTEVGLELNRMLSDILSSQNGSDTLMANIEQLQNKLVEQQSMINSVNSRLSEKETENHELQLELEINNKKVIDLQSELDKMVENLLKIEEEKEQNQNKYEAQISELRLASSKLKQSYATELSSLKNESGDLQKKLKDVQRSLELKSNEYNLLKDNLKTIGSDKDIRSLLDVNSMKAEIQQLQQEKILLTDHMQQNKQIISGYESQLGAMSQDLKGYKEKYVEADREKVQVITKLDVLNTYFKEKEAEMQKEISKHESMWMEKQGEASSTVGRIKFMQEEIQNFKAQNESLKQEIISQEVELKSQISVLEKKAHESWVAARQAERKLEDVKQEAATLRNRLTLRERNFKEDKSLNRLQSPLESNGDHPLSPLHMNVDLSASPPLLYGARDHLTTSPPIPGLPPFLPPPPGVPFIPPPIPGIPPFMPPPPSMYPGDHRPPPLGRMSSPPLNSRYSPDSRPYLPYDRNSPSPTDDEYYGISHRGYSPYNGRDRRDYDYHRNTHRPHPKKGGASSGSANSNESLDKLNRHNSKV